MTTASPNERQAWDLLGVNGLDNATLTRLLASEVANGDEGAIRAIEPSLIGTGQVGENVRCVIEWEGARSTAGLPPSVVVKLASSDETSRAAAQATRTYIREVGFYRDVAASVAIRVPKAYHVSEHREANRFVLIMEDITPSEVGNQLEGCSIARAQLAVAAAADLHGSTWGLTELADLEWIDTSTPERAAGHIELFRAVYPGFVSRYQDRLSAEEQEFGDWLESHAEQWFHSRSDDALGDNRCLVHGDFRLDNMLFGTGQGAPPLTTVDWQTPSLGNGLTDVAYFLSGSLTPTELRKNEADLLAHYRARLAKNGVQIGADQMHTDYRLGAPAGYVMAVIASQLVGQTERGDGMFMVMAKGSAAQAIAIDTPGLLA